MNVPLAADDPVIQKMRIALVKAVMPLEVIRMSGWDRSFTEELRKAVTEGVIAVREALNAGQKPAQTTLFEDADFPERTALIQSYVDHGWEVPSEWVAWLLEQTDWDAHV